MEKNRKRAYTTWQGIKKRCYNSNDKDFKSYGAVGVKMCDEWLEDFETFNKWYQDNYYSVEGEYMAIDKDLFGDGKLYSPETCCFLPFKLNGLFVHKHNGIMRGLQKKPSGKYEVKVRNTFTGENEYIGLFSDINIAHKVYCEAKECIIQGMAEEYKYKIPSIIYERLSTFKLATF